MTVILPFHQLSSCTRALALTIFTALLAGQTQPATAEDFRLTFPVKCTLGEDCFIQKYVDRDETEGYADFGCGHLTSDGHRGTDIALHSLNSIAADVSVMAAASGTVKATRDGMPDISARDPDAPDVTNRNCGNAVIITHADGWETWYCHLKRGSIRVSTGDQLAAGDPVGAVGLSGLTEFPHLHMTVRRNGAVVDPFQPGDSSTCGTTEGALWSTDIPYTGGGLIAAGFSNAIPEYSAIKAGSAHLDELKPNAGALVLWGYVYGGRTGDVLQMAIDGPRGTFLEQDVTLEKNQAQLFRAIGRRNRGNSWEPGIYRGYIQHIRDDRVIDQIETDVIVER